jgi:beta-mannanase
MNTGRYSWCYGHVWPQVFIAAWRHIVTLFRGEGAGNVTWLWTINQDESGTGPAVRWWPGSAYVTWVGIDGYCYRPSGAFATVFGNTFTQVRIFSSKPILLSETRGRARRRPVRQDQQPLRRDAPVQDARAGGSA